MWQLLRDAIFLRIRAQHFRPIEYANKTQKSDAGNKTKSMMMTMSKTAAREGETFAWEMCCILRMDEQPLCISMRAAPAAALFKMHSLLL